MIRPLIIIGISLALALACAVISAVIPLTDHSNLAAAFLLQTPATPPPQDQSVVGSTDGIVVMGVITVLIVIVPILVRRKSWVGH